MFVCMHVYVYKCVFSCSAKDKDVYLLTISFVQLRSQVVGVCLRFGSDCNRIRLICFWRNYASLCVDKRREMHTPELNTIVSISL